MKLMITFSGTYECKMDPKGRIVLPARHKARLPDASEHKIVIVLGFKKCLTIYTMAEWEKKLESFAQVSEYDEDGQQFIRDFTYGIAEETLDSLGRFSLNKILIQYAGITGDVIVAGVANRMEIWSKEEYEKNLTPMSERPRLQAIARGVFDQTTKPENPS
jgi:MraZ protein